ncbi:unnamed protein product, partial [Polarella glacialis]
ASSHGNDQAAWAADSDTGESCLNTACYQSLGPTVCSSYRCLCQTGYVAVEGKCVHRFVEVDTGGTCRWFSCSYSRGPTTCDNGRCICQAGYQVVSGLCLRIPPTFPPAPPPVPPAPPPAAPAPPIPESPAGGWAAPSSGAACGLAPGCKALGLNGDCCPTPDGARLGCCPTGDSTAQSAVAGTAAPTSSTPSSGIGSVEASCGKSPGCSVLGLE